MAAAVMGVAAVGWPQCLWNRTLLRVIASSALLRRERVAARSRRPIYACSHAFNCHLLHIDRLPLHAPCAARPAAGVLSLAKGDDPMSGGSSFSVLLGEAPHLDMHYSIFG